jgi:hypothetical protein
VQSQSLRRRCRRQRRRRLVYMGILRWRAVRSVARWQADGVGRWYESECVGVLTHIDR